MKHALWPIILGLAACGSNETPTSGAMERPRGVSAPPAAPAATAAANALPTIGIETVPAPEPPPTAAPEEEKKKDDAPPRDYSAELLAALGAPVECLHERSGPDAPSELRMDVQVYLLESGFVSRAYVRSPQLDEPELQCLTKRASALRLTAPVEAAPRAVNATLTMTMQRVEKPAPEKAAEAAAPKLEENP
jgi:hypothetical protein